ncbi:class I SAM-dependent methyltransferase [Rhodococcus triatomae]|uniref:Methyltransferase domain-containing protein n=1 Tax=Rhodococcus triatomae TaxID=300028 RepID=A0A1G8SPL6_9NOCA|nr:class I SAM-dependent methyltransferase [Rhodococcus triatomae]QNG20805.1 class I SAM-dependent methyltransferase [Rhodococcus triatomae]QNG23280.1 class I SAM-dependent methyltransferase [Rhodococcus triatomae]SDJ31131.1 Methyltransferase domain-containing protein [Rhodococcus triatomae]
MSDANVAAREREGYRLYSSKFVLGTYNLHTVWFNTRFVWRCSSERMLERYRSFTGARHLDIGPGTGWYLERTPLPEPGAEVTLFDLNRDVLATSSRVLRDRGWTVHEHVGSVLEPFDGLGPFDSVAANFVFHCVPGGWDTKYVTFESVARALTDDGVFFGSTIPSIGVTHSVAGRVNQWLYQKVTKTFHNEADDVEGLREGLEKYFADVDVRVEGGVALFEARRPRRG